MMIPPLLLGVFVLYMLLGWLVVLALDRHIGERRSGGQLWVALLFWPITVIVDLFSHRGARRG